MCFCRTTAGYANLSHDFNVFLVGDATLATFPANTSPRHATNAAISFAFPPVVAALGATLTFGLFAVINVGSILFVKTFAPETRGRSLEQLEDQFRDAHDAAHLVHEAPAGVYGS